jgi:hypothetical protein
VSALIRPPSVYSLEEAKPVWLLGGASLAWAGAEAGAGAGAGLELVREEGMEEAGLPGTEGAELALEDPCCLLLN